MLVNWNAVVQENAEPMRVSRRIREGDIIFEDDVRGSYGLRGESTHTPWRSVHSMLTNAIICTWDYKNDYKNMGQLQSLMDASDFLQDIMTTMDGKSFWFGGSGGDDKKLGQTAECHNNKVTSLTKANQMKFFITKNTLLDE